ncbi:MAG: hypothetical protein HUU20_26845 [Pirellulales bacterium]|nr:hypothetical protein [Pirellulales bacterium]
MTSSAQHNHCGVARRTFLQRVAASAVAMLASRGQSLADVQVTAPPAGQPSANQPDRRLLKRLVFVSHPYAWETQFIGQTEALAQPRWGGFTGGELVEMERRVSRRWPEEVSQCGPETALVINGFSPDHAARIKADGPLGTIWEAGRKHLGDRCLITADSPGEAYGRKIVEQLRERGYAFDPGTLVGEGWGQSFEGCLPRWAGGVAAAIGMTGGIPMRYEMTFPDAPFAMTGRFVDRLRIGQTDVYLYLLASREGRPLGIFFPGVIRDSEPQRFAQLCLDPEKVEFTTKRAEPYAIQPQGKRLAVPLNIDGRGDPIYVWSKGLAADAFQKALAAAEIIEAA